MSSQPKGAVHTAVEFLDSFAYFTGRLIAWLTLAMMLITCLIVVLRYGFSLGSIALQESLGYLHAAVFLIGMAFTLQQDGHVRVDIFYRRYSQQQKAWVNALGGIVFLLPFCLFIVFTSWEFVASAWAVREGSPNAGGIPAVFLLKTLIPLAAILLALQGISSVLRSLLLLTGEQHLGEALQPAEEARHD